MTTLRLRYIHSVLAIHTYLANDMHGRPQPGGHAAAKLGTCGRAPPQKKVQEESVGHGTGPAPQALHPSRVDDP